VALKPSYWQHNFAGLDMLSAWRTTGYPNRSLDSCGPVRRYKDSWYRMAKVKTNMKRCGLRPQSLSTAPCDRAKWRTTCQWWPPRHLRSCGLPSWTGNRQLASSRSSTPPARFGRMTDAAGPAHHRLGSSPISVPIGDAVHHIQRCTPCVCVCVHGRRCCILGMLKVENFFS